MNIFTSSISAVCNTMFEKTNTSILFFNPYSFCCIEVFGSSGYNTLDITCKTFY